jgi:phosphonate transport system ATP-binding protein
VAGLQKTFPNGHTALRDVSFTVPHGQFVCIVGRSGAGKSTLMRCLNGSLPVTAGAVQVGDQQVVGMRKDDRRRLQRAVGFIYQEFNLVGRLNAFQNVLTGRLAYMPSWKAAVMYFSRTDRELALASLERVNMLHKAVQRADSLPAARSSAWRSRGRSRSSRPSCSQTSPSRTLTRNSPTGSSRTSRARPARWV